MHEDGQNPQEDHCSLEQEARQELPETQGDDCRRNTPQADQELAVRSDGEIVVVEPRTPSESEGGHEHDELEDVPEHRVRVDAVGLSFRVGLHLLFSFEEQGMDGNATL